MREATLSDLVAWVCTVQPELDTVAATRVLNIDADLRAMVAAARVSQHRIASSLLELHLGLEGMPAA